MTTLPVPEHWATDGAESVAELGEWDADVYEPWMRDLMRRLDVSGEVGQFQARVDPWAVPTMPMGHRDEGLDNDRIMPSDIVPVHGGSGWRTYNRPWSSLSEITGRGPAMVADYLRSGQYHLLPVSIFPGVVVDQASADYAGQDVEGAPQYITPWNIDIWVRYAQLPYDDQRRLMSSRLNRALQDRDEALGIDWGIDGPLRRVARDWVRVLTQIPQVVTSVVSGDPVGGVLSGIDGMMDEALQDVLAGVGSAFSGDAVDIDYAAPSVGEPAESPQDRFRTLWNASTPVVRWRVFALIYRSRTGQWPRQAPPFIWQEV